MIGYHLRSEAGWRRPPGRRTSLGWRRSAQVRRAPTSSDRRNSHIGLAGREELEIVRIVREDQTTARANGSGHDQCIDRHLATPAGPCQEMAGDSRDARAGGHDACEATTEDEVDRFISSCASIELQQDCRRHADRRIASFGRTHGGADPLVPGTILFGPCECRERFRVENQDGQSRSKSSISSAGTFP